MASSHVDWTSWINTLLATLPGALLWLLRAVGIRLINRWFGKALETHHRKRYKKPRRGRRVNGPDTPVEERGDEEGDEERE